jgi:O-6-methylguanine DNA methyltransferase
MSMKIKYQKIYSLLKQIPNGKVTTYGSIARKLGINPRYVGKIPSENSHPDIYPCYRVVRSDGHLGGYTIGLKNDVSTLEIKKEKLIQDGVLVIGLRVHKSDIVELA